MSDKILLAINYQSKVYSFTFHKTNTLYEVKQFLNEKFQIPIEKQEFNEIKIKDDKLPLSTYNLGDFALLNLYKKETTKTPLHSSDSVYARELQERLWKEMSQNDQDEKNTDELITFSDSDLEETLQLSSLLEISPPPCLSKEETLKQFEGKFGTIHPQFSALSLDEFIEETKSSDKLKLIYLYSFSGGEIPDEFCQEGLCDAKVTVLINEHYEIWAGNLDEFEDEDDEDDLEDLLQIKDYPYLGIFSNTPNSRLVSVINKKWHNAENLFLILLDQHLKNHPMNHKNKGLLKKTSSVIIREQQDKDYEESMRRDQERERLYNLAKEYVQDNLLKKQQSIEKEKKMKEEIKKKFQNEPQTKDTIQFLFLNLNGEKVRRKFLPSETFETLFLFIEYLNEEEKVDFKLVCNYPLKEYQRNDQETNQKTLKELKLGQTMFLVRKND
ncbi:fas-associated protein [Anaeramoeba flamelloides]|uniref:Fas-associated protein n=1 Tax=Anaeramoeba flamelloides TaxID=1746091 RepID=A0AAV7YAH8_9EUKA|nr:fas-associated protein [Anaeramoeba flamelloides]